MMKADKNYNRRTEKDYNYNIDCGNGDVKIGDILFEDDLKKRNINIKVGNLNFIVEKA